MKTPRVKLAAPLALLSLLLALTGPLQPSIAQEGAEPATEPPVETGAPVVPDELLVRFRAFVPTARAQQVVAEQGAQHLRDVPALDVQVLRVPPGLTVEQAVRRFSRMPEVDYAEPNYILSIAGMDPSNDYGLPNQWAPQKLEAPGANGAWAAVTGIPAVTIAVVDTGIDYLHSELAPNMWANPNEVANGIDDDGNGKVDDLIGWDFVNSDADPLDDHSHGTHVAGIAAADDNANPAGLVGICPDCTLMAVKVLDAAGSAPLDRVASGITYAADEGARVINLSLGATTGMITLEDAVNYAWGEGAVIVAAAGNNGAEQSFYPAAYANAIAVASTDVEDYRSCYSNYGAFVDVAAPGESIYSTVPRNAGVDAYATYSGTSMASPHVAGLAGLLFSRGPQNRTNTDVRSLIESTTTDLGLAGADSYFGTGRINARRAVTGYSPQTAPAAGLVADQATASAYANARKLARDASGTLHLAWHSRAGSQYRILYSTSTDGGVTWSAPSVVFESGAETYHPALALDNTYVYLAFPSKNAQGKYEVLFTSKPLLDGGWSPPVTLMGGAYDAVRPAIYADPTNGRIHVVGASLDNARYVYYVASNDQGATWDPLRQVDPSTETTDSTRYAAVHAHGNNVYIAVRSLAPHLFMGIPLGNDYFLYSVRSTDGGANWELQPRIASYWGISASEYGVSLAGVGDRIYMGYEVGSSGEGGVYFRRWDGVIWSNFELVGPGGTWPTITQADDGQGWLIWQDGDNLLTRHYTGSAWEPTETLLPGNALSKNSYPNLKLGTSGDRMEWVTTNCKGAPFRLIYSSRYVGIGPEPTPTPTPTATATLTPSPTLPPPSAAHIGDLDATAALVKKGWQGKVTIRVHDPAHKAVSNAIVLGVWSNNSNVTRNCTVRKGTCVMTSDTLATSTSTVTFAVTGISHATLAYDPVANHDPDGDSSGTTITMSRP